MTAAPAVPPAAGSLATLIAGELAQPVTPAATAFADALAARGGGTVAVVLFYGSALRTGDLDGLLDFYVLVDRLRDWHQRRGHAAAGDRLPPNVEYWEIPWQGRTLRAKVAVMRRDQFARAVGAGSLDTTIWARFCQPVRLVHARDGAAAAWAVDQVARAVATAAGWAVRLGPDRASPRDYWDGLFRRTYAAELRVERGDRAVQIVDSFPGRFEAVFLPALAAACIAVTPMPDGTVTPALTAADRTRARRGWARRRLAGKPLNIARLVKAAFTFTGGVDYLAWKVERHSGQRVELTPWQRRHPILAAPLVLWRLWRRGVVR